MLGQFYIHSSEMTQTRLLKQLQNSASLNCKCETNCIKWFAYYIQNRLPVCMSLQSNDNSLQLVIDQCIWKQIEGGRAVIHNIYKLLLLVTVRLSPFLNVLIGKITAGFNYTVCKQICYTLSFTKAGALRMWCCCAR